MHSKLEPSTTVGQLVAEKPSRSKIFEKIGIDYCCGGKKSLSEACLEKGMDVNVVITELTANDNVAHDETNWSDASLADLIDHIVSAYHNTLREELKRLESLLKKVAGVHGEAHPELKDLSTCFLRFKNDLEMHMQKEEMILFPLCKKIESSKTIHAFHCGGIANPIQVMRFEHDTAGADLELMSKLTNSFTPPADACNSFRALLDGLAEITSEMHEHVHLENNILFPRAIALETSCSTSDDT
ncbi:MAG: iron-sulfur cluster repair di-iron protein [Candidatus Obscuribacterales bacterium]|nr:iron-sulfur cluster repair di-iron protein [Candidatus Obscuribacterales bacterium]